MYDSVSEESGEAQNSERGVEVAFEVPSTRPPRWLLAPCALPAAFCFAGLFAVTLLAIGGVRAPGAARLHKVEPAEKRELAQCLLKKSNSECICSWIDQPRACGKASGGCYDTCKELNPHCFCPMLGGGSSSIEKK